MTQGELVLARVNIGMLVETWLRFFYCAHYEDYCNNPVIGKVWDSAANGYVKRRLEPEGEISFSKLQDYSIGILWRDVNDPMYKWVGRVRDSRNAVHSFQYHEIGTNDEFLADIETLYSFVKEIAARLPPLEDCICILSTE